MELQQSKNGCNLPEASTCEVRKRRQANSRAAVRWSAQRPSRILPAPGRACAKHNVTALRRQPSLAPRAHHHRAPRALTKWRPTTKWRPYLTYDTAYTIHITTEFCHFKKIKFEFYLTTIKLIFHYHKNTTTASMIKHFEIFLFITQQL